MDTFLIHLLICSLWCLGFWKAFDKDMIFEGIDLWARGNVGIGKQLPAHLPNWLYKPLMGCLPCLASIHGITYYLLFVGFDFKIILFVVCLSGLNFFLSQFFNE